MVNPKRFYTYAYLRENRTPYYVGKGGGNRLYEKHQKGIYVPKDKNRIIFLKQNLTEEEAFKHEIYMIAVFGRKDLGTGILHNRTGGGEGVSGYIFTETQRQAVIKSNIKRTGWSLSEKAKIKIGEKSKGRKHTGETKEKIRKKALGRKFTEETKQKLRLAGVSQRPEVRKKISEANRGEKNAMYGKKHTEETKQKIGGKNRENMKGKLWWNNGQIEKRGVECPGDGWERGRIKKH